MLQYLVNPLMSGHYIEFSFKIITSMYTYITNH